MAFQFYCPQGHLLQSDPAHMGQQCQCPHCGTLFVIPTVVEDSAAAGTAPWLQVEQQPAPREAGVGDFLETPGTYRAPPEPVWADDPAVDAQYRQAPADAAVDDFDPTAAVASHEAAPRDLHIPCPNGHILDTPLDMLGQEVLCPHCQAQFRLRREDSLEDQVEQERRDHKRGEKWLIWSIVAAVAVLLLLGIMIAATGK